MPRGGGCVSKILRMGKKPLTVVAFELGPDSLKFVEMARAERRVVAAGIFPLAPGRAHDRGHLAAQLRSALDVAGRGLPRNLIASVPMGEAALRVLDVPVGLSDVEIRDYTAWDMSVYLGHPVTEFVLDVQPGATRDGTETKTMIAAALPRTDAVFLKETLESATGLPLAALDVDAAALVNGFSANYPELTQNRSLLILANTSATTLIRTQHANFQGALVRRDAGAALSLDAAAQERAEGLLRLTRGIVESLRASLDGWDSPDHILLAGDLSTDADFRELLKAHLSLPVAVLNPFRNIPGPDPLDHPDAYPGAPLAAAVGLALRLAEEAS